MSIKWATNSVVSVILLILAVGILVGGISWAVATANALQKSPFEYRKIDGMTCLTFRDTGVTCQWSKWNGQIKGHETDPDDVPTATPTTISH